VFSIKNLAVTEMFLAKLREKHPLSDAIILADGVPWLQAACHYPLRFQYVTKRNRNAVKRVFKELKRRTEAFVNPSDTTIQTQQKPGSKYSPSTSII
jgi:transposase-like protein